MINRRDMIGSLAVASLGTIRKEKHETKDQFLMVFYICVGSLPPEKANKYVETIKEKLKELNNKVTTVFIPQRTWFTSVELFKISDSSISIKEFKDTIDEQWLKKALEKKQIIEVQSDSIFDKEKNIKQCVYNYFGYSGTVIDAKIDEGIKLTQKYNICSSRLNEFIIDYLESFNVDFRTKKIAT